MLLESLLLVSLLIFYLLYKRLTEKYRYWEKRGIPCIKAKFPFGSMKDVVIARTFLGKEYEKNYTKFSNEQFYGIIEIWRPTLVVKDLELIKKIMVKDFQHFVNKSIVRGPDEYLMKHLANLEGEEWKTTRTKLSPTFTSGKLKLMFHLMEKCGEQLKEYLEIEAKIGEVIDAKDLLARFTMDVISTCAFGIESNAVANNNSELFKMFGKSSRLSRAEYIKRVIAFTFPYVIEFFRLNLLSKKLTEDVTNMVRQTVEYRERDKVERNDFIDLLMNVRQNKQENGHNHSESYNPNTEGFTTEQMAAHTLSFFFAGFETTSSILSFCLFELARHQDIQQRLFHDLKEALDKNSGKMSYQVLMDIPFLDQVIDESLRLYGSTQVLHRICNLPYKIPDSDLTVEKGMKVVIPIYAIHHDPQHYPEPYEFKPERFSPEESKKRHPFAFLPFGGGPRICIGSRFALSQIKVGLATVILSCNVELSPDQDVPLKLNKRSTLLMPEKVLLKLKKREN